MRKGYSIVRNVFSSKEISEIKNAIDLVRIEGEKHQSSFRDKNLMYLITPDDNLGSVLRFCQWPSYANETLEKYRTDTRFFDIIEPLIGNNVKQIINQIIWKPPGAMHTSYGFHQDARFRRPESAYRDLGNSFVQTALAIDPHTAKSGCVEVLEGSHLMGNLNHHNNKSVFEEDLNMKDLKSLGLGSLPLIQLKLEPGDVALWHPHLLHGSRSNKSAFNRRSYLNGYVKAENCDRGEWAFKNGKPTILGEPQLVQFEGLYERPEPHYINGAPHKIQESKPNH